MRRAAAAVALLLPALAWAGIRPRHGGELEVSYAPGGADVDPVAATTAPEVAAARALHATLLEAGPAGALRPVLLEAVPQPEESGRAWRLRLAEGCRFHDGTPITATDVAASLARLASAGSRHAWLLAPVAGWGAVHAGEATALAGVEVLSDRELRVVLAHAWPDLPRALATAPSAVVRVTPGAPLLGAGPFRAAAGGPGLRLTAFDAFQGGRPFLDAVVLRAGGSRRPARPDEAAPKAVSSDAAAAIVLRADGGSGGRPLLDVGPLEVVVAVASRRLAAAAEPTWRALAALDRADVARLVRAPVVPLSALLPPPLLPARPAAAAAAGGGPARLRLLLPEDAALGPAAERVQVRLYDHGVRATLDRAPRRTYEARLASGDFDVALVAVPLLTRAPALALAQVTAAVAGADRAARVLAEAALPGADLGRIAAGLEAELHLVPLYAAGWRLWAPADLQGLEFRDDGSADLGAAWLAPAPAAGP